MLTLFLAAAIVGSRQGAAAPIVVPIKGFLGDPIVSLSVDGKPPEDFGLDMTTRHSIVKTSDDAGLEKKISFNGKTIATGYLESPGVNVHPELNDLGLTVLNGMAIGIDYGTNQITFWPGGRLSEQEADAWILKSPKWMADSQVWKTKIEKRADVAPVVPVTVAGKTSYLLLRLGREGTSFAHGLEPASGTPIEYGPGGNHAILADVHIGGTVLPWILYFRGIAYDPRTEIDPSITGTFTTENLLARRVILDLPGNVMYSEQLSTDAQVSMFLSEWLQLPLEVSGDKIFMREMPGTHFFGQFASIYNSEVLEIMGQPAATVVEAAKNFSGDHVTLLKVMFERVWQGFRVKIKRPGGDVVEISLAPPK
jgi:hypothetical protein